MNENKQEVPFELMQFPGVKGSDIHARTPEQDKEDIKNWIEQGSPTKEEEKEDEMLIWFVMAYGSLEELVKLKKIKDELDFSSEGNDIKEFANAYLDYKERKKMAWYAANQVIELWKKSDYGANLLVNEFVLVKADWILKIRDALVENDFNEAYHWLYQIASPHFDKALDNVWKELETKAAKSTPNNEIEPDRFPETLTLDQLKKYNEGIEDLKKKIMEIKNK